MTARQCLEAILMELSKVQAPSLKLYEFNYYINKAINQYVNKIYNIYDINQQTTDDLRVLKTSAFLTPKKVGIGTTVNGNSTVTSELSTKYPGIASLYGATYEVYLPLDYIHMLNCICIYKVNKQKDCFDAGSYIQVEATRLTADAWSQVINDLYNRPTPMHPYYYIHNNNQQLNLSTNPIKDENVGTGLDQVGNDISKKYSVTSTDDSTGSNFKRTYKLNNTENSLVEKNIATRISNPQNIRCEIRYGQMRPFVVVMQHQKRAKSVNPGMEIPR